MAKTPRFNPYEKLLFRVWETLCLAQLTLPPQGHYLVTHYASSSFFATRRRFQRNLAFICDYKKGGDSATALAIEDSEECFRFWVASNQGISPGVLQFLRSILVTVAANRNVSVEQQHKAGIDVAGRCTSFSRERILNICKRLSNACKKARAHLEAKPNLVNNDMFKTGALIAWLPRFEVKADHEMNLYEVCRLAYHSRHDEQMRLVELFSRDPDDGTNAGQISGTFASIKHFVGRLAAYIRASKELIQDAQRLHPFLDTYQVAAVELPRPAPVPAADSKTNLKGILDRMTDDRGSYYSELLGKLESLNASTHLEEKIVAKFNGGLKPRVHAEVQVLEHFYTNGLKFANGDKHVACSKPACMPCKLYFHHHPATPAWLDSHEKIYCNWAPIALPNGKEDKGFIAQRNLLNKMIPDVNHIVLQHLEHALVAAGAHPDSLTMITEGNDALDTPLGSDISDEEEESGVSLIET